MASQKQINANRRNGCKGRGPRTPAGKVRSRKNAHKHGLCVPIIANQSIHEDVLTIARDIAGGNDVLMEPALVIAEAELTLQRIQQARSAALNLGMNKIDQGNKSLAASNAAQIDGVEKSVANAFLVALPLLECIERYERRAYSRLKKARARFNDLQMLSQLSL